MDTRVFDIEDGGGDPRRLTQSVLQATDLLGFYQAELARMLSLQCGDIGHLTAGRRDLAPGSTAWRQARLFVRLYRALYVRHHGDGTAMYHWLRVPQAALDAIPHRLMVDEGRLADVVRHLEATVNDSLAT